jgi:hypothetical protein
MFDIYNMSMKQPENAYGINSLPRSPEELVIEEVALE